MIDIRPKVSVVIPVHNEEDYLLEFLPQIVWRLKKTSFDWQVIISENGSQDKTLELAQDYTRQTPHVNLISSPHPNYGLAVKKGFLAADGDYLVLFDIDYFDIEFVEKALLKMDKYDALVGSKLNPQSQDTRPFLRRLATSVFSLVLKIFFGLNISDTHGIKILNRQKFLPLIKNSKMTQEIFDTEILLRAQRNNLKVEELPISVSEKRQSRSSIILRGIKTLKDLARLKLHFIQESLASFRLKSLLNLWPQLSLAILTFLLLRPSLKLPFSLIDDGLIIDKFNQFFTALNQLDFTDLNWLLLESRTGRSRPFFWLFMFAQHLLVGNSAFGFHLLRVLFSLLLILTVYQISYKLTRSKFVGLLSSLPTLLFYRNMENFYRLGSQEVPMPLFLLLGLLLAFIRSKKWTGKFLAPFLIFMAILTKETAVFILPLLILGFFLAKKNKPVWRRLLASAVLGTAFVLISRLFNLGQANYASNFELNLSIWLNTFLEYKKQLDSAWLTRLFQLSILSFIIALFKKDKVKIPLWSLAWITASFGILLPWKMALGRYLTPVLPALGLFIAYETYRQLKYSLKQPLFIVILLAFFYYWANFIFTNTIQSLNVATDFVAREQANAQMVKSAARALPQNSTLYFNFVKDPNFYEWISETERHFYLFHKRPDLKTKLLDTSLEVNYLATWSFPKAQMPLEDLSNKTQLFKVRVYAKHLNPILKDSISNFTSTGHLLIPVYNPTYSWYVHQFR